MKYLVTSDENLSLATVERLRTQLGDALKDPESLVGVLLDGLVLHDLETGRSYGERPKLVVPPAPNVIIQMTWPALIAGGFVGALITAVVSLLWR